MKKSNEMSEPEVLDYSVYYRVTPLFINDLKTVMNMGGVAYVDAKALFDRISERNGIFPTAVLTEFIRDLGNFPFKVVANIMSVISVPENFNKYFEKIQVNNAKEVKNNG